MRVGTREIEHASAEEQEARRAQGARGARLADARKGAAIHMDAGRKDRPRTDLPEPVIDVEIVADAGEARGDRGNLVAILGEVGVHQHIGVRGKQRARAIGWCLARV